MSDLAYDGVERMPWNAGSSGVVMVGTETNAPRLSDVLLISGRYTGRLKTIYWYWKAKGCYEGGVGLGNVYDTQVAMAMLNGEGVKKKKRWKTGCWGILNV